MKTIRDLTIDEFNNFMKMLGRQSETIFPMSYFKNCTTDDTLELMYNIINGYKFTPDPEEKLLFNPQDEYCTYNYLRNLVSIGEEHLEDYMEQFELSIVEFLDEKGILEEYLLISDEEPTEENLPIDTEEYLQMIHGKIYK